MSDGTIVKSNGQSETLPAVFLDQREVELLKSYRKFLEKYGLKEALYCNECWEELGQSLAGCEAFVTPKKILIRCRHRMLYAEGLTS